MYERKDLDFGFVILSPEHNTARVASTMRSIQNYHRNKNVVCAVGEDTTATEMKELKKICPNVWRGKDTITSLINVGMKRGFKGWNMLVMEGVWARKPVAIKYSIFIENEKNILYPVIVDRNREGKPTKIYRDFDECSLNGIFIHQETFKEVGEFPDYGEIKKSKFLWHVAAKDCGCKFKGIFGAGMC